MPKTIEGSRYHAGQAMYIENTPETVERESEMLAEIRSSYLAGVPLFTKKEMYAVRTRFKELDGKPGKVLVTGINGHISEFTLKTRGEILPFNGEICGEPCIRYHNIQNLMDVFEGNPLSPEIAFCTLHIYQRTTKEVDDSEDSQTVVTEDMVKDKFNAIVDEWEKSKQCQDLLDVLWATDLSNVKQIIAFSCGRMSEFKWERPTRRSMHQHALVLTLRKTLQGKESPGEQPSIPVWAQDPAYREIDTSILAESEISVLDDPDGFIKADDSTLVLSISSNACVKQIITDICRPAAIIWNTVEEKEPEDWCIDGLRRTDPDSPRVRQMISQYYDVVDFPFDKDLFGDVTIYVRREKKSN